MAVTRVLIVVFSGEIPVQGKARIIRGPLLNTAANFSPPQATQHPRMVIRYDGVDALRQRAQTPLGSAALSKLEQQSGNPFALGLLAIIHDNSSYAMRAIPIIRRMMADDSPGSFNGAGGEYAKRVAEVAKCYDLCYRYWSADFRQEVEQYLARRAARMLFHPDRITRKTNQSPNSNYSGHMNGAAAIAALCIFDKSGPQPIAPRDPGDSPRVIKKSTQLGTELPIQPYLPNHMPKHWISAGPFPNIAEPRKDLFPQGSAQAKPTIGDTLSFQGNSHAFKQLPEGAIWDYQGGVLEIAALTKHSYHSTSYVATGIAVDKRTTVKFNDGLTPNIAIQSWLSGQPIDNGDLLTLEPGVHQLLMRVQFGKINSWGKAWIQPIFSPITPEESTEHLESLRDSYEVAAARYQQDLAFLQSTGASPWYRWLFESALVEVTDYHRYTFGDGGFQTEGELYTQLGAYEPIIFEVFFRNQFGHPSTGANDVSHFTARHVMQIAFDADSALDQMSFSLTDAILPHRFWGIGYHISPTAWQPAVLWAWNKILGISDGGDGIPASKHWNDEAFLTQLLQHGGDAANLLLYYPFEQLPTNPEQILTRTWESSAKGLYVFRDGWQGSDDIIAQFFLKREGGGGWQNPDAGAFRIWGLVIAGRLEPR